MAEGLYRSQRGPQTKFSVKGGCGLKKGGKHCSKVSKCAVPQITCAVKSHFCALATFQSVGKAGKKGEAI